MSRRTVLATLAWLATVVAATLVGMSAVGAMGTGLLGAGREPLTAAQVDRALAAARATPAPAAPTPEPPTSAAAPAPVGPTGVTTSPGGTVLARCTAGAVEVVSSSPAQGWWLDDEQERTRVRFETDETDVDVRLSCRNGMPVGVVEVDD